MDDLHLTRRQAVKGAAAAAALGVLAGPTAAFAEGRGSNDDGENDRGRVRWDIILVVTTPCIQPGGFASAFAVEEQVVPY